MKKIVKISIILIFLLFLPKQIDATGTFAIIEIGKDFNQVNFLLNAYNPPIIFDTCTDKNLKNITCSQQFTLQLPAWIEQKDTEIINYEARRFILYNPKTSAEHIKNCRGFSTGAQFKLIADILTTYDGAYKLELVNQKLFVDVPFAWNLEDGNADCYVYDIPIYNPHLVDISKTKLYPFDSYKANFGFLFPYETSFHGFIIVPDGFTISKESQINTTKTNRLVPNKNFVYFNFKPQINVAQMMSIHFSRVHDIGSALLTFAMLAGLPLMLSLFFMFSSSPEKDNPRTTRVTAFYLAIIPLFLTTTTFLNNKPLSFTLFDVVMMFSIIILSLNLLKDFMDYEKIQKWFTKEQIVWVLNKRHIYIIMAAIVAIIFWFGW